jgi:hypothetical protein
MLYSIIIFLAAFLLFQVQPLIAKVVLPIFGGGAAIWTACLLFFQAFLLLGYLYSHCITKLNSLTKQASVHAMLLIISLYFLPISLRELDFTIDVSAPMKDILMLLMMSVGPPYFILATTGPLVQRWLSYLDADKLPYKLYSLSNIGSLLALLSYPFLIEPLLTTEQQSLFWSITYFVYTLVLLKLCDLMIKQKNLSVASVPRIQTTGDSGKKEYALWLLLSAVGVLLLVSTTSAMTQNVPPVPFLWILPLCIYLLTFIISFHSPHWYVRWYWFVLFVIASFAAVLLFFIGSQFDIITQIALYSLVLLSACMICHGELARLKPAVERLTLFYLNISIGGFLGSLFIAFVAQNIFSQFYEFPLSVFLVYVLFVPCVLWHKKKSSHKTNQLNIEYQASASLFGLSQVRVLLGASALSLLLLLILFTYINRLFSQTNIENVRNFYGILSVKDVIVDGEAERRLIDGTTSHGTQSLQPDKKLIARSYYRSNTGVAIALDKLGRNRKIKAGFIGLGAGTMAAYGRAGDNFTFYELNPNVVRLASSHFTYLAQSKANIEIILGDGRMSLAEEMAAKGSQQYQLLVIDAFSSDSIPIHLLTKEAFDLYWQHLATDGILAVHISNSHLDLTPIVRGLAKTHNKEIFYVKTDAEHQGQHEVEWVLLASKAASLSNNLYRYTDKWPDSNNDAFLWTDDYSNLLSVLR